jgi:hypothetical protein
LKKKNILLLVKMPLSYNKRSQSKQTASARVKKQSSSSKNKKGHAKKGALTLVIKKSSKRTRSAKSPKSRRTKGS